jgi:hypothetical protein
MAVLLGTQWLKLVLSRLEAVSNVTIHYDANIVYSCHGYDIMEIRSDV